ncbi:MAG: Ku protein [Bacteroidota bacterium]
MSKVVWKGSIAFSLVSIPVNLYPAAGANELDLHLLDRRDFSPVGYERINKRTGEAIAGEDIVKGYEYAKGQYVVLGSEDFRQANVKATQTVDIVAFVEAADIPVYHFDTPYYLEPERPGIKGYALLRETLRRSGRVGLAKVVIRTRQYLATVIPVGRVLVLNTLRFADEIRPLTELELPTDDLPALGIAERELTLAEQLLEGMSEKWAPEQYHDSYRDDLMARIQHRIETGDTHIPAEAETGVEAGPEAEVVDLVALLKRSLQAQPAKAGKPPAKAGRKRA